MRNTHLEQTFCKIWLQPCRKMLPIALMCCSLLGAAKASAELVDRIVAVVNNEVITLGEYNQYVKPYLDKVSQMGYTPDQERQMLAKVKEETLRQLIDQKLTEQEIARLRLKVTEDEQQAALERVRLRNGLSEAELKAAVEKEGIKWTDFQDRVRQQILRSKLVNVEIKSKIVITREDVRAYYDQHLHEFGGKAQYHLQHIILKKNSLMGTASGTQTLAQQIIAEFHQGTPFKDLVRRYSQSAVAGEDGDLGTFELTQLAREIRSALEPLQPGQITGVIDTDQGYQIFYVKDIIYTAGKPFEEMYAEIEDKLFNEIVDQKFSAWLENLRTKSYIKVNL